MRQEAAQRYDRLIDEDTASTHFLTRPTVTGGAAGMSSTSTSSAWPTASATTWCATCAPRRSAARSTIRSRCTCRNACGYLGHREGDFPVSEQACREVLALPMFPEITVEQQRRALETIGAFSRKQKRAA